MNSYECGNEKCKEIIEAKKVPYICPKCGCHYFGVIDEPISAWDQFQMVGH